MFLRWFSVILSMYLLMIIYWYKPFNEIIAEGRYADFIMFIVMGLLSGTMGFFAVNVLNVGFGDFLRNKLVLFFLSLVFSVAFLALGTNFLIGLVTAT